MTERELLKLALDAFGEIAWSNETQWQRDRAKEAIVAIKEALAQPEQPKVRTGNCLRVGVCASEGHKIQPQRPWVGLTDEEKQGAVWTDGEFGDGMLWAEKLLKERNT